MEFADWLRNNLNNKNLTQAQLSRKSGISEPHISRLLSGAKAGEEAAKAIAKALKLPPEEGLRAAGILDEKKRLHRPAEEAAIYKLSLLDDDKLRTINILLDALLESDEKQIFEKPDQKITRGVARPPERVKSSQIIEE